MYTSFIKKELPLLVGRLDPSYVTETPYELRRLVLFIPVVEYIVTEFNNRCQ